MAQGASSTLSKSTLLGICSPEGSFDRSLPLGVRLCLDFAAAAGWPGGKRRLEVCRVDPFDAGKRYSKQAFPGNPLITLKKLSCFPKLSSSWTIRSPGPGSRAQKELQGEVDPQGSPVLRVLKAPGVVGQAWAPGDLPCTVGDFWAVCAGD